MALQRALVATLAALIGAPVAVSAEDSRFSFGAFGTFGVVHSDESRADFARSMTIPRGAGASGSWATDVDSLLGAQVDATISPRLSAVVQVVAEHNYDNTFRPHVEWANLKLDLSPHLSVRFGRTALPGFMHTESRKVAFALPWVRTPQEVYELAPVTSNDGIDVIWTRSAGRVDNTLQMAFGSSSSRYRVPGGNAPKAQTRDQFTVADTLEVGNLILRATYGQARLDVPAVQPLFDAFRQFGPRGDAIATRYEARGTVVRSSGIAASFDSRRWFAMGEWGGLRSNSHIGHRQGWYASTGVRFGRFTPYVTYGEAHLDSPRSDPGVDTAPLPSAAVGLAVELNTALNVLLNAPPRQATASAGLRFDIRRNISLKAQYDHIDLAPDSKGTFVNLQPDFVRGGGAHLLTLSLDFVL